LGKQNARVLSRPRKKGGGKRRGRGERKINLLNRRGKRTLLGRTLKKKKGKSQPPLTQEKEEVVFYTVLPLPIK